MGSAAAGLWLAAAPAGAILTASNTPSPWCRLLAAAGSLPAFAGAGDRHWRGGGPKAVLAPSPSPCRNLLVKREPQLHRALGLYEGLQQPGGCPAEPVCLMCAGILGSPGTLAEVSCVLHGAILQRSPGAIADDDTIQAAPRSADQGFLLLPKAGGSAVPATVEAGHDCGCATWLSVLGHWRNLRPTG